MTRILVDLPDEDIKWLDSCAIEQGKSRASVLREAVSAYKALSPAEGNKNWILRGAGIWADRTDIADGLACQRAIRADRGIG